MKRALLFVNRQARQGQQVATAIETLQSLGFDLLQVSATNCEQLSAAIRRHQNEIDLVIIGGGDGTLNAIVDCLVETQLPLGILPLGTANDLARTLDIPTSLMEACQTIAAGHVRSIDLGWVNGKHFFNVASLGLSVKITERLSSKVKRRWGVLAYALTALQVLWQTRPFRATIYLNGETIAVKTVQIAVGNGRYYGGGMAIAPDAAIDDQRLDLYSLEINHWWQLIPLLPRMRHGHHTTLPWVRALQGREIKVHTREPHAINTDGELTMQTPATFRVIPHALAILVPLSSKANQTRRMG